MKCGTPAILRKKPEIAADHFNEKAYSTGYKTMNTTVTDYSQQYAVPVVFHIVLTEQQIKQLGGKEGINQRIKTQMEVINQDFNHENSDSNLIPAPFKPLYGNVGVRFALARTRPSGAIFEDSCELYVTTKNGFELYSKYKSGIGFTEAKYAASGGLDAWDPSAYLNVWVVNPLDSGKASRLAGLTMPPSFVGPRYDISVWEQGIVLHYGALGKRQRITDYYVGGANQGRTLTHELGHFFDLWHIWGDDNGACPGDMNGNDDRISDTPPQAKEIFGNPAFPLYDSCTRTGTGIMFMNFMDYTDDRSKYMFTQEQAARARQQILPGAPLFSLTKQPQLTEHSNSTSSSAFIYPNPVSNYLNIFFETTPTTLQKIELYNAIGQSIYLQETNDEALSYYRLDVSGHATGIYLLQLHYKDRKESRRVYIAR